MSSIPVKQAPITPQLKGINIGVGVMAAVFVFLRFLARWLRRVKLGADDYLMMATVVFLLGGMINNAIAIENGLGVTWSALDEGPLRIVTKCLFIYQFIYLLGISIVKIAILMTYFRIFDTRRFKISTYIVSAIISAWCVSFTFVYLFACMPIYSHWDFSVPGVCLNLEAIFICNALPNILTDVTILVLPIREVWKLQMVLYQRIYLTILFLLGSFVLFTSAYRISTLFLIDRYDQTYSTAPVLIWSHIEYCAAMVSASLPILRPLVDIVLNKTGIRVAFSTQSDQEGWRSGIITIGSNEKNRRIQTQTGQITDKEDDWPPAANVSSDEVPVKTMEMQIGVEGSQQKISIMGSQVCVRTTPV